MLYWGTPDARPYNVPDELVCSNRESTSEPKEGKEAYDRQAWRRMDCVCPHLQ